MNFLVDKISDTQRRCFVRFLRDHTVFLSPVFCSTVEDPTYGLSALGGRSRNRHHLTVEQGAGVAG
jgi:hypothetical protein